MICEHKNHRICLMKQINEGCSCESGDDYYSLQMQNVVKGKIRKYTYFRDGCHRMRTLARYTNKAEATLRRRYNHLLQDNLPVDRYLLDDDYWKKGRDANLTRIHEATIVLIPFNGKWVSRDDIAEQQNISATTSRYRYRRAKFLFFRNEKTMSVRDALISAMSGSRCREIETTKEDEHFWETMLQMSRVVGKRDAL